MATTKKIMVTAPKKHMIGMPLEVFALPSEYQSAKSVFNRVFLTGKPEFHVYTIREHAFLYLFDRIEPDIIAAHEILDDPDNRGVLRRFLTLESKSFYNQIIKESAI